MNLDDEDPDNHISMRSFGEGDDQHVIVELKSKIEEPGQPTRYSIATYDLTPNGLTRLIKPSRGSTSSLKSLPGATNPIVARTFEAFKKVFVGVPEYYPNPVKSGEAVAAKKKSVPASKVAAAPTTLSHAQLSKLASAAGYTVEIRTSKNGENILRSKTEGDSISIPNGLDGNPDLSKASFVTALGIPIEGGSVSVVKGKLEINPPSQRSPTSKESWWAFNPSNPANAGKK